jgi:hypothetical protein
MFRQLLCFDSHITVGLGRAKPPFFNAPQFYFLLLLSLSMVFIPFLSNPLETSPQA